MTTSQVDHVPGRPRGADARGRSGG
jgi:hypothetical protein